VKLYSKDSLRIGKALIKLSFIEDFL